VGAVVKKGIDLIVVGYHQPQDAAEFWRALMQCRDETPWNAIYISVEATNQDILVGGEIWGENHYAIDYNCGHATACNLGALACTEYDTLFFCNADSRLYNGNLDRLYETLWSDPSYGVVGPRQVDEQGRITAAGIFGTQAQPLHRAWQQVTNEYQDLRIDAVTTSGAMYMIKRSVWDEMAACPNYREVEEHISGDEPLGAMPKVFHYFGETHLSYHMASHGYLNIFEGRTTSRHDWHKASPIEGGYGEIHLHEDREHFRRLCDNHDPVIPHD
jgi:hypothetical protein